MKTINPSEILAEYVGENTTYELYEKEWVYNVVTPFIDGHNDNIELYIKEVDGGWDVSDGGYLRFETLAKHIPLFVGTTRFKSDEEVHTVCCTDKLASTMMDLITLIMLVTNQQLMNKMLWSYKNDSGHQ